MIGDLIKFIFYFFYITIIGRVIISWINLPATNPIANFLFQVTEPILAPIRRILPNMGMLDLSPMIAILLLSLIQTILASAL